MAAKSLYVGNLPYSVTENDLRDLFAAYDVANVRLIGDKGFGFVDVPEERAAEAIAAVNGREVGGRALVVNEARPRRDDRGGGERRSGFGGGGGGGHRGGGPGGGRRRW